MIEGHISSLEGYADAAEAAEDLAKAESDASDGLLITAQDSEGLVNTLLGLLDEAKSNRDDAVIHYGTA